MERKSLLPWEKLIVLKWQNHCCAECGDELKSMKDSEAEVPLYHFDHKHSLAFVDRIHHRSHTNTKKRKLNSIYNFQALCLLCHAKKTKWEMKALAAIKREEKTRKSKYWDPKSPFYINAKKTFSNLHKYHPQNQ